MCKHLWRFSSRRFYVKHTHFNHFSHIILSMTIIPNSVLGVIERIIYQIVYVTIQFLFRKRIFPWNARRFVNSLYIFLFCSGRGKQISCLNKWHRNFRIMSKYNNKLLWENYLPDCNWHNECFLPLMHVVRSFQSMPINLFKNDHFITLFGEEKKRLCKNCLNLIDIQ